MQFTEEEARAKWCPFARQLQLIELGAISGPQSVSMASANRSPSDKPAGRCIASGCMAWRNTKPGCGYCGLAGKPA